MIKILVIGSGFDKSHGLKTRYVEFLEWFGYISSSYNLDSYGGLITVTEEQRREYYEVKLNQPKEFKKVIDFKIVFGLFF